MDNQNVIESTAVPASQLNLSGVLRIPAVRQVTLLIGVAAAVAAGFAIAFWSQSPNYTQLYGDLSTAQAADVVSALRAEGIDHKIDSATGNVLVAEKSLHRARFALGSQGLSPSAGAGMSAMSEQSSFGVSQFMENARYQHALENELARTIASLGAVSEARVHLAVPKQSAFIRDHKNASASVFLRLFSGRALESDQSSAIVHLVASSVPNLNASDVTLIDQYGRLLSSGDDRAADAMAASQFKYARRLEDTFRQRIEDLLTPLVGPGRVRAQVVADVDFTMTEETRESFDPARSVVRSEQTSEDLRRANDAVAAGVPGALSNQPPEATGDPGVPSESEQVEAQNTSRMTTRNYEVDRTISHTRPQAGTVRKLSVAVLVDDSPIGEEGAQQSLTEQDIARYTALVKEAVGFSEARGDTVVVMNEAFRSAGPVEEIAPPPIWEQPFVRDVARQALGAILVLAIAFGVVRPMLKSVVTTSSAPGVEYAGTESTAAGMPAMQLAGGAAPALSGPNYEEKVAAAKNITGHDPARVAQVVKQWVTVDE